MDYITVKDAAKKWNISARTVQSYRANKKIPDAKCIGKQWMIPSSCERPVDGRSKENHKRPDIAAYHFPLFAHSSYFSNKEILSDEEKLLYDAEMLFLTGDLFDCILKCRQLQSEAISPSVIMGSHFVVGYAAMLLGLYTDYQNSIYAIEKIIERETTHKTDYQLLLAGLKSHVTRDFSPISDIDTSSLSFDALYYCRYLLMMSAFVNLKAENENAIRSYLAFSRELELKGITPTALCVNCMLSFFYKRIGDFSSQKKYMQKGCDIAVNTQYNSLFTKYYVVAPTLIDECLSKYGHEYIDILKKAEKDIMIKWLLVRKISNGNSPLPEFSIEQNEILTLMPGAVPIETIARIKNMPLEKVEEAINEILKISGVESIDKLPKYVREKFNEMTKNTPG